MLFAAMLGLNMLQGAAQYQADKAEAKARKAWQRYSNTMVNLSNSLNQNAITDNEVMAMQESTNQAIDIKKDYLQTAATTEVSAAAAGVKGRSVNQALFDVQRNANIAEGRRQGALENAFLAFDQQRQQSSMSAAMQKDYSYIPKPKFASYMLKAASSSAGSYNTGASFGANMGFS